MRKVLVNSMISIAIDGPSGAGKSTLARMTAADMGFVYVDTGAIYRTVGLFVQENGIDPADPDAVASVLPEIRIEMQHDAAGMQRMLLNGRDVTAEIRLPEISMYASAVSAIPAVRAFLLQMQREMARKYNVLMDGRDIGTVVLPDADLKVFLTASAEERAKRRYAELLEKHVETTYEAVLQDMLLRDKNDSTRDAAPLRAADDAVLLDTTGNTLEQSLAAIRNLIRERLGI